jgi:tRNA(Ile)-lysidine synthase
MPAEDLSAALRALPPGPLALAVSGGADSVALLVLAAEALGPARLAAVTVDHGLRPEAAAEAAGVGALCARLEVRHTVLRWEGPRGGNLLAAARAARMELIAGWARGAGIGDVALAHTRDDQAETVLMNLGRGSGVDGLSAMPARRRALGVVWWRPFLGVARAELRAALTARGIGWVEDPSNTDPRFLRARLRAALPGLAALGLTSGRLADLAGRMQAVRAVLDDAARAHLAAHVTERHGAAVLSPGFFDGRAETVERAAAALLRQLTGAPHAPRLADLRRLIAARAGTLGGAVLRPHAGAYVLFREPCAVAGPGVPAGAIWDGRCRAEGPPGAPPDARIAALGAAGVLTLGRQARAGLHPHWRATGLPPAALPGLPAIWSGDALIAAPLAFWPQGWRFHLRPLAVLPLAAAVSD